MLRLQNAKFDIAYIKDIDTNHRRQYLKQSKDVSGRRTIWIQKRRWDTSCNRSNACHNGKVHRTPSNLICVLCGLRESIRQDKLEKDDGRVRIDNVLSVKCEIGRGINKDAHYQHYCTYYMIRQ